MFVRTVQKPNDRISLRIVENVSINGKVKQKTVCGLGCFHKSETKEIDSFKRIGESMIVKINQDRSEAMALPGFEEHIFGPKKRNFRKKKTEDKMEYSIKDLEEEARIYTGSDDILSHMWEQLGLFDSINTGYKQKESNNLLKKIVLERVEDPQSKRKSVDNLQRKKNDIVDLNRVYRMMDRLHFHKGRVKNKITQNTYSLFKHKIDVVFFDVTTLYFESFIPDELRISGYSKDNKFKETQVVLALMTTSEGLPLGYELFPGNTYEGHTLINAINTLSKKHDISNTFVVADRGMFVASNLQELSKRRINFIIASKLKTFNRELQEEILHDVSNIRSKNTPLKYWIKEYCYGDKRLIVSYSEKRAKKSFRERQRMVSKLKSKERNKEIRISDLIKNGGEKKYLKLNKKGCQTGVIDSDKIKLEEQWDGIYGVITNYKGDDMSLDDIISRHRDLWQIENAFRVNKRDLKMRPVYHWTPRRIEAHILICFMAYSLLSTLKYSLGRAKVNLSIARIREELSFIQASIVRDRRSNKRFLLPSKLTKIQRDIYTALGLVYDTRVKLLS